jgi:hypothetical protein
MLYLAWWRHGPDIRLSIHVPQLQPIDQQIAQITLQTV